MRVTIQALAAVLGGAQSLHTNSMDEALALPTEEAVQVALRTQQIIAYESGVADTIDPLGGSYAVEALTEAIYQKAREYIARIDSMGGSLAAIENGFMTREIQDAAYAYQQAVESRDQVVVGVNQFAVEETRHMNILRVAPAIEQQQRARLAQLRAERDGAKVTELLGRLDTAARGTENLLPLFIECVEHDATLGEICGVLRKVFGEYRPDVMI